MSVDPPTLTLTIESDANGEDSITLVFTFEGEATPDTPSDNDSLAGTTWEVIYCTLVFTDGTNGTWTDLEGNTRRFTYEYDNQGFKIHFDNSTTAYCRVYDNLLYYDENGEGKSWTYCCVLISGSVENSLAGTTWVCGARLEFTDGTYGTMTDLDISSDFTYKYSAASKSGTFTMLPPVLPITESFTINGNTLTTFDESYSVVLESGSVGNSLTRTTWVVSYGDYTDTYNFTDATNGTLTCTGGDADTHPRPFTYTYTADNHTGKITTSESMPPEGIGFTVDVNKNTLTFKFPRQIPSPSYTLLE